MGDILKYFSKNALDKGIDTLLDVSMPALDKRPLNQVGKEMLNFFGKDDFNYMVFATITCVERDPVNNNRMVRRLHKFLIKLKDWKFYIVPAYQESLMIHFHGLLFYNGKKSFQTSRKKLQYELNKLMGWSKLIHMRATCKSKIVVPEKELNDTILYCISDDNYGGCREYPPLISGNL